MKAVEIQRFGLEGLRLVDRPEPDPGPGQILLRMQAASLNARDLMTARGQYNPKQSLPLIPCSDGVGRVEAIGEGVTRVREGDRVTPIFAQQWISGEPTLDLRHSTLGGPRDGTLAEWMVIDQEGAVVPPAHLTDEECAALPCAAVTAWSALVTHGEVREDDVVLVQGTGGVSIFALQFATMLGARVIVTSSSDEKLARARELGAWETINYNANPDWGKQARKLTGGNGVDLIVEVGGARTLTQSLAAIRFAGRICLIGVLSGVAAEVNVIPVLMQQVRIQGLFVGHREGFEAMNRAIETHTTRPVVDRVFPLDQTRAAMECLAGGEHFGKICIRI